jgi:site-specific DNA recombinase
MPRKSDSDVRPRNEHTLIVGSACRISGCANQKELSLEDQEDNVRELVAEMYQGPAEFRVIATKAKGERLDRPELEQIEAAYRSREYDLFVYDDLSRLIRGGEAARLLGVGVDHGTRSICIDDGIDTVDPTWEEDALNACSENVAHNERTSKRVKQKSMNRFKKYGRSPRRPIASYLVPEGATTYDEWRLDETATEVVRKGAEILRETLDCAAVADYFDEIKFPVGPYCKRTKWDGKMVARFYGNPLLKGEPQRGRKHTVKHHETGRRVSVNNPQGPKYYHAPHLAHLTRDEFDELNLLLAAKNACHRRKRISGLDPLFRRARTSRFPGMHARCFYCGWHHVWGANGLTESLMCSNSRDWHCWHSLGFSGPDLVTKLVGAICDQLPHLDQFDEQFAALVATADVESGIADAWKQLRREEAALTKEKENVAAAVRELGPSPMVVEAIQAVEAKQHELLLRRHKLERRGECRLELPETPSALHGILTDEFCRLAVESPAFASLMRSLVPEIFIYAIRLCDGGHLLPRAKIKLNLGGTYPALNLVPGLETFLTQELTLDLFVAPQRERIRKEAVKLAAAGMRPKAIAQQIEEKPTPTAVQNALALHRRMDALGLTSPYVTVLEPPVDYPKLRRHRHPRYQFQPLEGYQRPAL